MKNAWIAALAAVAFLAGVAASPLLFKKSAPGEGAEKPAQEEAGDIDIGKEAQDLMNISTVGATVVPLTEKIPVTGQIAQDVEKTDNVTSPVPGVVVENTALLGAVIRKGDRICRIKPNDGGAVIDVRSPYNGVVIGDFDNVGEKVETVSALCAIADLSRVYANFDIYEKDIAKVKSGQKVVVRSMAYPEEAFEGSIVFVSPRVDEMSRTVKIRAEIRNPGYLLKLGMFVSGEVVFQSAEPYLVVPVSALQTLGDERIVFVRGEGNTFHKRVVRLLRQTAEQAAVSGGIKQGDPVVTQGAFLLKSGLLKDELEGE